MIFKLVAEVLPGNILFFLVDLVFMFCLLFTFYCAFRGGMYFSENTDIHHKKQFSKTIFQLEVTVT